MPACSTENDEGVTHILKLSNDTFAPLTHNLYYNSYRVKLVENDGTEIVSDYLIDTAEANSKITQTTDISSDMNYKGIELTSGAEATVSVSNTATTGIVGSTILNNNTLAIESGSTFNQLDDNNTNKADFSAGAGTVNLGGTLTLANTNTATGSNKIGVLNTTSSTAVITGANKELSIREINIDGGEGLAVQNIINFDTSSSVNNSGTITIDGGTVNSGTGMLNLGTIASGTGSGTINVNAGTTTATATSAAKINVNVSTAATFKVAATSTLDTVTLKGTSEQNPAHLDIAAGTVTLDNLAASGHGTVKVAKDASLEVTTGTTVGTETAVDKDSAGNNSLNIIADNTSSGSIDLGALSMGNGTLLIDDCNNSEDVLTISADSLTLTGASMLNGADAGVVHKLKIGDNTLTDNNKYLYYNSKRVQLVGSDGTTAVTSNALKDIADVRPVITSGGTITHDSEYSGIRLTNEAVRIIYDTTVGIFGDTIINSDKTGNLIRIDHGSTLNQLNDINTNTADFNITGKGEVLLNGTLNLANTNSTGNKNYICLVWTNYIPSSIFYCPKLIANEVTIGKLATYRTSSVVTLKGKVSVDELYYSANNSLYASDYNSSQIVLDGVDLTLNKYNKSYPEINMMAINQGNKLTNFTESTYKFLQVKNGELDIVSTSAKQLFNYSDYSNLVTAETCDSTLSLFGNQETIKFGTINLSGSYDNNNTPGDTSDDSGYHAILDISNSINCKGSIETLNISENSSGKLITDTANNDLSETKIYNYGTLYMPLNSTTPLKLSKYYSSGGRLDISSSVNNVKSVIDIQCCSLYDQNWIIADGDGSGGKDKVILHNSLECMFRDSSLIYDSSKLELVDSSRNPIELDGVIDIYDAPVKTAENGEKFEFTSNGAVSSLDVSAAGAGAEVGEGNTAVVTDNLSAGSNSVDIKDKATIVIQGTLDAENGTLNLGNAATVTANGSNNKVNNLNITGELATISGTELAVKNLKLEKDSRLDVQITLDLSNTTTSTNANGEIVLAGEAKIKIGDQEFSLSTLSIGSESTEDNESSLEGNGKDSSQFEITAAADVNGHLNLKDILVKALYSGELKISSNTLELTDSILEIGTNTYITGVDEDLNDSHIEALGAAAGNTSTIDNHSIMSSNTLALLDVVSGTTAGYTTTLDIDNTAATDSIFNLTTINVTGDTTGGAATLNFKATGGANSVVQDINIGTLNIKGVDATGTATVTSQNHTDLAIDILNFDGTHGVFDNQVAFADTSATTAKIGELSLGTVEGDAVTGTLKSTVSDGKTTIREVTITGGTSASILNINGDDANDIFDITTLILAGADAVGDAVFNVNNNSSVSFGDVSLAAGNFGTINNNANTVFTNGSVNGELKISGVTLNTDNGTFTIGSTGRLDVSANNMIVDNSDKLIFDLGTNLDASDNIVDTAKTYASSTGNITTTKSGTEIERVYGKNGVSGETYLDVVSFAGGVGAVVDNNLQAEGYLRIYTLKDTDGQGDAFDILVSTNSTGIHSAISEAGGSSQDAANIEELVNRQVTADSAAQGYISQVLSMSSKEQITAMEEKRGEDATTATTQAAIKTISSASGAVSNQLTAFRSGNLAAGMSSSFSSSGATAALNEMVDAEMLEDAYSSAGYTADTGNENLRNYQVWANGFGGFGEQGSTNSSRGYDFHNIGTMVGIDYRFAEELRLGGLLGYSYNVTEIDEKAGESKDNTLRAGAYASYKWNNFFADFSPTIGIHFIESQRNLNTGVTATGKRTAIDFNLCSTIGYTLNFDNEFMFTPSFSLGFTTFHDPEYTETGAGVQNNKFSSFTSQSLLQDLGVKFGKLIRSSDKLAFLPEVWGGWEVEYLNTGGDRDSTTSASLFSNTYTTTMDGTSTNRGYWGAGLTALIMDNVSVFGRYDHKIWNKGYNVGFSAGIKVAF